MRASGRATATACTLVLALATATPALATKPCPELVCYPMQTFDEPKCRTAADWIFTGKIIKVVDHPKGEPLFKNFAEFTVQIDKWEKNKPASAPRTMKFRVGWCTNARTVPEQRKGVFRFYGTGSTSAAEPQYLWFEPL